MAIPRPFLRPVAVSPREPSVRETCAAASCLRLKCDNHWPWMSTDDEHDDDAILRPFLGSSRHFEHLHLAVHKACRTADGGVLMDAFNVRQLAFFECAGDVFDAR